MTEQEKREKVLKGLEYCTAPGNNCDMRCLYYNVDDCEVRLKRDALDMLKAHEPAIPLLDETGIFYCANCKKQAVGYKNYAGVVFRHNLYCPLCGKAVKWDA